MLKYLNLEHSVQNVSFSTYMKMFCIWQNIFSSFIFFSRPKMKHCRAGIPTACWYSLSCSTQSVFFHWFCSQPRQAMSQGKLQQWHFCPITTSCFTLFPANRRATGTRLLSGSRTHTHANLIFLTHRWRTEPRSKGSMSPEWPGIKFINFFFLFHWRFEK